jgi:membrane associated rhomboid family serine protease
MGILLAFGMIFPNSLIFLLFPPIPIRAKYLVVILMVIDLVGGISSLQGYQGGVNIAHFAHLGGMLFGFILIKYWSRSRRDFY